MILYTLYFILGLCVGSFFNAVIWRLEKGKSVIAELRGTDTRNYAEDLYRHHQCHPEQKRRISSVFMGFFGLRPQNDKRGIVFGRIARSYCPHCRHKLAWHDLIPVLSFIWLRGKCGYCGKNISWQYPIVEIAAGVIFVLIVVYFGNLFENWKLEIRSFLNIIYLFYIVSALIIIFVYDLKHYIIPDKILFPAIIISFTYRIYEILISFLVRHAELVSASHETLKQVQGDGLWAIEEWQGIILYILSAVLASGFFLLIVLISRGRAMGMGDVKLAFLMGLILGWPNILVALFLAFMFGALVGLALIFSGRKKLKSRIPFGPFLITGIFIALFWGSRIIEWYWGLLL